ncbi:MAG: RNA methyltransferase [Firmicutes bacterium]|nr:RNA methyltransferase [Bacillota bacterium]
MPRIIEITDLSLPELDVFARLTEAQLRSRVEPERGVFIAESPKVIDLALAAGCRPQALLMERRQLELEGGRIAARCGDIPVYVGQRELLARLTGYRLTRGVLCAMSRPAPRRADDLCREARRLAVLEGISDSTNIGAVFRSAAALGVDGVLLTSTCCDPLCRRAVRVSMGTVLLVPWAVMDREWPEDGLSRLRELGFTTLALALSPAGLTLDDPRLQRPDKLAMVLGTEGDGLAPQTVAACDHSVRIPMARGVDSLNVAAAGAVAFWELRVRD